MQSSSTTVENPTSHESEKTHVIETGDEKHDNSVTENAEATVENVERSKELGEKTRASNDSSANTATEVKEPVANVSPSGKDADGEPEEEVEDESKYLSGFKLWILSLGLCLTTFVIALDNTIIATAIPKITSVFNSLGDVGWYGSAYLLTTTSLQPSFGKVYTYFDVKYTYLISLVIFEVGSVICAAATSSPMFIVGRAVAGTGAAALYSGGMTIIGFSVPLRKRAIYIAALSSMFGIASVVGPILGGAFTDRLSWRWCFWINLPFGAISLIVVFSFFSNPERQYSHIPIKERLKYIDLAGAVFLICSIVCLLLALQWGGFTYSWKNSKVWGTLLGFGLLLIIFIIIQIKQKERATIPIHVFKQRTVLVSCIFSALLSMALYTHIFYLPFYFQAIKGTTAEESGIRTIAYLVSITVSSIVIGASITIVGWYVPFMWFGSAIFTIGAGLIFTLKVNSPPGQWIGYQILAGIGAGAGVQIPFVAVQVVTSSKDMPTANACVLFFNSLGGALSISIAQNIFVNTLAKEIPKHVPGLDSKVIAEAGATNLRNVVSPEQLPGVLEGYNTSVVTAFILAIATAAVAFFVSLGMEQKSVKGKKIVAGGAA
ncbi:MFS transporter [Dothidotthia symphoricarpi CBS 119687]|uniref:MFS transporter n=1 Tax=Dothidotthia symphoricarpi CBS 119687 TaxID=1392245 RepID=A0A6A6AHX4_9PLEO|nr:MFS transporter [Dothidotthia symphoricarpi CBS 119687]KAF2131549.1 MFS transporter [Dothidotthia symphoricarpi CBS 119687]